MSIHYFDEITVRTQEQPNGDFTAVDAARCGDLHAPTGRGLNTFQAIADLFEKLPRAESDREDRDIAEFRQNLIDCAHDHRRKLAQGFVR